MPGKDEYKVCVKKLPANPNEEDLKAFFARAGEVIDIYCKDGRDGWFAFVGYNTQAEFEEALKLNGREFEGVALDVQQKQGRKCFNCGKDGHISAKCPGKGERLCFKCQRPGHVSRDCPGAQAQAEPERRRRDSRSPVRRRRDSRDDRRRDSRDRRRDSRSPRRDSRSPKRTRK